MIVLPCFDRKCAHFQFTEFLCNSTCEICIPSEWKTINGSLTRYRKPMNGGFELAYNASFKYRLRRKYKGMQRSTIWATTTQLKLCDECFGRQVYFAGCRLQVAGWNLIITGKPLALRRNVQLVDLPWLLHDAVYTRSARWLPLSAKPAEAMGGRVYSYDFKPAMNYCFWRNIWNIIWNICWIWFLPSECQNESTLSLC